MLAAEIVPNGLSLYYRDFPRAQLFLRVPAPKGTLGRFLAVTETSSVRVHLSHCHHAAIPDVTSIPLDARIQMKSTARTNLRKSFHVVSRP